MAPDRSLRGFVVLIVEDDAQTLMGLLQLVGEALGCGLLSATCAEEALRIIDSGVNVDLVFSDVVMPQMDGVTLADLIRRRLPGLPVVLATGRPDVVDWVTERGGIALLKPYSLDRLEAVFAEHLLMDRPQPPTGSQPAAAA